MTKTAASSQIFPSSNGAGKSFTRFAWGVLAWNLLVVLWGAYVRATGSGAGCGNHWPTCNGAVIPRDPELKTIVEYSHRLSSGVALILVVALVVWAFRAFPRGHLVRLGAALSGLFIVSEALVGAALVLLEHTASNPSTARGWSLSIHLINTFTLLAVLALTAWWSAGHTGKPHDYVLLAGIVVLSISGAIAALGDTLFPITSIAAGLSQDFSPSAHLFVRLRILHPAIAVVISLMVLWAARKRIAEPLGLALVIIVAGQLMIGLVNVALLAPVWMQLVHLAGADALWIVAVLLTSSSRS